MKDRLAWMSSASWFIAAKARGFGMALMHCEKSSLKTRWEECTYAGVVSGELATTPSSD
jgi:hypothetical protein